MIKNILLSILIVFPFIIHAKTNSSPEKEKNVKYAFLPVLMYNRSFGGQFGIMANAYFNVNRADTISPSSSVAFIGNVFTNKTFFTGLFSKYYFNEDRWRVKVGLGYGDIKFQTYLDLPPDFPVLPPVVIPPLPYNEGAFIDYRTKMAFVYTEGIRKIADHLYIGGRMVFSNVNTEFNTDFIPEEKLKLFGFGIASELDYRNNVFYPTKGMNSKLHTFSFLKSLGSSETYHRINFDYNRYFSPGKNTVIMGRLYGMISLGENVPFSGQNVVGRDDLRGYTNGKYRANQVYDIQTELRWNFYKKWGMVAFTGIAAATDNLKGENYSGILPMAGAGLRFKMIPSKKINIGVDAALGKDDWGVYFRIGEAFTR